MIYWIALTIVVAGLAAPLAFAGLWSRKWFKVIWWISVFLVVALLFRMKTGMGR